MYERNQYINSSKKSLDYIQIQTLKGNFSPNNNFNNKILKNLSFKNKRASNLKCQLVRIHLINLLKQQKTKNMKKPRNKPNTDNHKKQLKITKKEILPLIITKSNSSVIINLQELNTSKVTIKTTPFKNKNECQSN